MLRFILNIKPLTLVVTCILFNVIISDHYFHKKLTPDEDLYRSIANAITRGDGYFFEDGKKVDLGNEVTPFYSSAVAIVYKISGVSPLSHIILNVIFCALTIVILYYTIILIVGNKLFAFFLSFGFIFYFPLWAYNFYFMMEITTVFFLALSIYLYCKYYFSSKDIFLYGSFATFALLCLINNRFIILLTVLIVFQFLKTIYKRSNIYKSLLFPSIIIIIILSPWFIRQYIVYDQFVFFTPNWHNIVVNRLGIFNNIDIETESDHISVNKPLDYYSYVEILKRDYGENSKTRSSISFTTAKYDELVKEFNYNENLYFNRLKRYFKLYEKDFSFLSPNDFRLVVPSLLPYRLIQILILLPLFVFTFIGSIIAIFKKNYIVILLSLFFISHITLHVLIHYIDRYRLTVLPVLLIISAYGFSESTKLLKSVRRKQIIIPSED